MVLVRQKQVFVTEFDSVVDEDTGRGVLLSKGKPFFVIDIPNQKMILNRSRLPGRRGWRQIFNLVDSLAYSRLPDDCDENLLSGGKQKVGDCYYSPFGLPEEMYVDTYSKLRYATFPDGRAKLDLLGNQKIASPGGICTRRPKIESVYATDIDEYVLDNFDAYYEPKQLVFRNLATA